MMTDASSILVRNLSFFIFKTKNKVRVIVSWKKLHYTDYFSYATTRK